MFTTEDELYHKAKYICLICFNKVRDHCHEAAKYRGPACKISNLRCKQESFIPVIFHNGSGYDIKLIYNELFK